MDSDVERALQHAIGQANSAFANGVVTSASVEKSRKKGKKRAREETETGKPPKEKRLKTNTEFPDEPTVLPGVIEESLRTGSSQSGIVKPEMKRKEMSAHTHSNSANESIDLSVLVGESSSNSPANAVAPVPMMASMPVDMTNQSARDLYYLQAAHRFPNVALEDQSLSQYSNSNDDILRAFQDLDLARLAGVLRNLDIPFSPQQSNRPLADTLQGDSDALFLDQAFPNAGNAFNLSATVPPAQPKEAPGASGHSQAAKKGHTNASQDALQPTSNFTSIGPSIASPEHTHLLATKWLSASKLKALVETEGLVYKKGKFSALEEQALKTAIENYRVSHGLSAEEIINVIFAKSKEDNVFWPEITASVPARPITAVYHHVHRAYHPLKYQGKWTGDEDVALLKAVADCGQAWQKVSDRVGRMAQDCRDRWKNHLVHRAERHHGHWTKEEEEELTRIVTELLANRSKESDHDIFWSEVSKRMGNKRGRQQCRIKWTDALSKTVKNSGRTPRWSKQDSFILVQKVVSLDVRDDSEIDWNALPDEDWNLWSAHLLQRRWRSLKLSIKGHETIAFGELLEILQQKNFQAPAKYEVALNKAPRKEPKSAETIDEDEDDGEPVDHE